MKNFLFGFKLLFFCLCISFNGFSQLVTGSCVHGGGVSYLLDAYLASIGACSCERSGVILTGFPKCAKEPFSIEFEDNFDGDSLDLTKWELPGNQGALEGAQNVGVYTLNNVILSNGVCHLTGKKETLIKRLVSWKNDNDILQDGLPNLRAFNFTSGLIRTKKTFFYGKYEIRCKMPSGKGFWPAFWTFGGTRWNEIDFFDNYAGTKEFVTSLGHDFKGTGSPNGCNYSRKVYDLTEWHTFTCIFDYDKMTTLIDGEVVREVYRVITMNRKPVLCGDEIDSGVYYQLMAYPMEAMNILVNMALISKNGPADSTPVDETTPFPSSFDVDYVRYWKRSPVLFTVYPNPTNGRIKLVSNAVIKSLEIHNLTGQPVYKSVLPKSDLEVDLSDEPNGVYILSAELEGEYKTVKIIKIDP